jgi:hypothetical protein
MTTDFDRLARAWLDDGPTELSDRALDAALAEIHLTRQRRALRAPWRFTSMLVRSRATALAATALVVVVGTAGLLSLNARTPSDLGGSGSGLSTTETPTDAPNAAPSAATPGITGWLEYTSDIHGFTVAYPSDWSVARAATRKWQAGDTPFVEGWPYADVFANPEEGDDSIAVFVWDTPAAKKTDFASDEGLLAWAAKFCNDIGAPACDSFGEGAVSMCLDVARVSCEPAILVPTADVQYAFFTGAESWSSYGMGEPKMRVVLVARPDDFPAAAAYGGSVQLLRSFLTTMGVTPCMTDLRCDF